MRRAEAAVAAVALAALAGGCSSHAKTPQVSPAPAASPRAPAHPGLVNTTRCNALRVTIRSNEQALLLQQTAGHAKEVAALRAKIATDLHAARETRGCDVSDLALPSSAP